MRSLGFQYSAVARGQKNPTMSYPLNHLGSIWYHSEPVSWLGLFFGQFLQQDGSNTTIFYSLRHFKSFLILHVSHDKGLSF